MISVENTNVNRNKCFAFNQMSYDQTALVHGLRVAGIIIFDI